MGNVQDMCDLFVPSVAVALQNDSPFLRGFNQSEWRIQVKPECLGSFTLTC